MTASLKRLLSMVVVGAAFVAFSCVTPVLLAPTSTPHEGRAYQVIGPTTGEGCWWSILGIPIATDASLHTALERAKTAVGAEALIDITVDQQTIYTFFYNRCCTIVRAKGIRFGGTPAPFLTPVPAVPEVPPAVPAEKMSKKSKRQLERERREAMKKAALDRKLQQEEARRKAVEEEKRKAEEQKRAEEEARRRAEEEKRLALEKRRAEEENKPVPEQYRIFCDYNPGDQVQVETKAQVIEAEFVRCVYFGVRVKKKGETPGVIPFDQIWMVSKVAPTAPAAPASPAAPTPPPVRSGPALPAKP